jgi:hypothetical protein
MIELLPFAVSALVGAAAGGGLVAWIKSRPATTRSMVMQALAAEARLAAKMTSAAASHQELADQEKAAEAAAAAELSAAMAKLGAA